jgi:hypothetical protein
MLTFIGIAVSDSVTFCINCIVKKCLEGIRFVHLKLSGIFYVCLFTHERRSVLTSKNSSRKRKYELIVIKLTNQYVCYNLSEKHKKFFFFF